MVTEKLILESEKVV